MCTSSLTQCLLDTLSCVIGFETKIKISSYSVHLACCSEKAFFFFYDPEYIKNETRVLKNMSLLVHQIILRLCGFQHLEIKIAQLIMDQTC